MADFNNFYEVRKGLSLDNVNGVFQKNVDPAATSEVAPAGSIMLRKNSTIGEAWHKYGAGNSEWTKLVRELELQKIYNDTKEPTGFVDRTQSTISFSDVNLRLSVAVVSISFDILIKGVRYTKTTTETVDITDTEGLWYFYYNASGVLSATQTWNDSIITDYVWVSAGYWDSTNNSLILFFEERHGLMPNQVHLWAHNTFGSQLESGGSLNSILVDVPTPLSTSAQLGVGAANWWDEDISFVYSALSAPASIPVLYKSGASGNWRLKTADSFPFIYSGTAGYTGANGLIPYNRNNAGTWSLEEITSGNMIIMIYFYISDTSKKVIGIQGQNQYTTIGNARDAILTEFNSLIVNGLPMKELIPIGATILQSATAYSNTPKARHRSVNTSGGTYLSLTSIKGASVGGTANDHGSLTGLTDLDHPASAITVDTTNFDKNLSSADTTVQAALETIDELVIGPLSDAYIIREVPSGDVNGTNKVFTLANVPTVNSEEIFVDGQLQNIGSGNDYTIDGDEITFVTAPVTGSVILVSYYKGSVTSGNATSVQNKVPSTSLNDTDAEFPTSKTVLTELTKSNTSVIEHTTSKRTASLTDAGALILMNYSSANEFEIPLNSSVSFPLRTRIDIVWYGAGETTITAVSGVTLKLSETAVLTKQNSLASIIQIKTDEWLVVGYLELA